MDFDYTVDKEDMRKQILRLPFQLKEGYDLAAGITFTERITEVLVQGMGGSGIPGDVLKVLLRGNKTPIFVNKDYKLPAWVSKTTLLFLISYSGNTEETISCYREALRKNANIVLITTGGKLKDMRKLNRNFLVDIPRNLQPRAAIAYLLGPMLRVLDNLRLTSGYKSDLQHVLQIDIKTLEESAKTVATKLIGKTPLIYAPTDMGPVAYRWKCQLNENSKIHAFNNVFSELNHNEIMGFMQKQFDTHVIMLRTDDEQRRMVKRMKITRQLLKERGVEVLEINIKGSNFLARIMTGILIGDFVSYYLALAYGIDPTPVALIEDFKRDLGPFI